MSNGVLGALSAGGTQVTPVSSASAGPAASAGTAVPTAAVSASGAATAALNHTEWDATPVGASLVWVPPVTAGKPTTLAWLVELQLGKPVYLVGGAGPPLPSQSAQMANWAVAFIDAMTGEFCSLLTVIVLPCPNYFLLIPKCPICRN